MIKVIDVFKKLRTTYSLSSKAKLYLKIKGDSHKYILNGCYFSTLENGIPCLAVHNQADADCLSVVEFTQYLYQSSNLWNNSSVLIYDNSVEADYIVDIKLTKSSVTFVIDSLGKNEARLKY